MLRSSTRTPPSSPPRLTARSAAPTGGSYVGRARGPSPAAPARARVSPMTSARTDDAPVVVGVLYPPAWYGDREGFAAALAALEDLDPRVEIVAETYVEAHDLRSARGKPGADAHRGEAPALTDDQRAAFARVHVALAIDLPFDVREVAP